MPVTSSNAADVIRGAAFSLTGAAGDYDRLVERIGNARFVLIGEASHGTHEFYHERAAITRRLIEEQNFAAVAVEADWPDAYRVNRYVRGAGAAEDAAGALADFARFPAWMWRNTEVLDFIGWLRARNDARAPGSGKAGFYGLDLYSMYSSIRAVIEYLEKVDPEAARRARARYACFEHFGESTDAYGYDTGLGISASCEQEVIGQLIELQRSAAELAQRDGPIPEAEYFFAEQNARLVKNAEEYYRGMFQGRVNTWNLRDHHMAETLDLLADHLDGEVGRARIAVWAHNSHLGDARATEMARHGELNIGQLVRQRHGRECVSIGFSTYRGTVTAASDWDGPAERKRVRAARPDSHGALLHQAGLPQYLLVLSPGQEHTELLAQPRLERAIGVVYRPETERVSHYFEARLAHQFDAIIHLDETRALEPLEYLSARERGEPPETYPSGL